MARSRLIPFLVPICYVLLAAWVSLPARAGDNWSVIPPQELALKDDPISPGAHAVILYRETKADHDFHHEWNYYRIKILTEEGRKYADIEILFDKDISRIEDIKARTVSPDGTVVRFRGKVFEKPVVKSRWLKYLAKTFTLPNVEVGSIIEYQYKLRWPDGIVLFPPWIVQTELSLLRGRFSVWPYSGGPQCRATRMPCFPPSRRLVWSSFLPPGKDLRREERGPYSLELKNVPPLEEEEFIPPKDELTMQVRFFYLEHGIESPEDFWQREGKERNKRIERFIGKRKSIERAVASLVSSSDSPEAKLRKLYARAQQIRNLTFERARTKEERKREKLRDNKSVEDVLKQGYGSSHEINQLFAALARAAGFNAMVVLIPVRSWRLFHPDVLDSWQLVADVVAVRLGPEELYLDPGTPFTPFGLLSWEKTGVQGVRPDKQGGVFVTTPQPASSDALVERKATLRLDTDGNLEGEGHIAFYGQEALERRLHAREEDEPGRREQVEEEAKAWFPPQAEVEIGKITGWESSEEPLRVEFTIKVPSFGVKAGRRLLLPLGVFQARDKVVFEHSKRVHPVYFPYPWQETDEITFQMPPGYRVEGVPEPQEVPAAFGRYEIRCEQQPDGLLFKRRLVVEGFFFQQEHYPALRYFFSKVKAGDEQQAILETAEVVQHE